MVIGLEKQESACHKKSKTWTGGKKKTPFTCEIWGYVWHNCSAHVIFHQVIRSKPLCSWENLGAQQHLTGPLLPVCVSLCQSQQTACNNGETELWTLHVQLIKGFSLRYHCPLFLTTDYRMVIYTAGHPPPPALPRLIIIIFCNLFYLYMLLGSKIFHI